MVECNIDELFLLIYKIHEGHGSIESIKRSRYVFDEVDVYSFLKQNAIIRIAKYNSFIEDKYLFHSSS